MTIAGITHTNQQESSRSMNPERSINQTVKNVDRETLINRGFDVYRAVTKNNLDDFLHHLYKGPILEEARGLAVITAAFKNNREFVEILLCNGSISTKDREWAIVKAGENSNFELVGRLLRSGDISEWGRASPWKNLYEKGSKYAAINYHESLLIWGLVIDSNQRPYIYG